MSVAAILLAQFGLSEAAFLVLRIIAGVGGAFIGWFVSDPLARITHRLIWHKPIPGEMLLWLKMGGAALLGLLVFFLIPLGGGPGGWGYGPGKGGSPGLGSGQGGKDLGAGTTGNKDDEKKKPADDKTKPTDKAAGKAVRKPVEIEVLGGDRYPGGERYYLLQGRTEPMTLKQVDAYFADHADTLELHMVITKDSPAKGLGVREDLIDRANRHRIPSLEVKR